MQKKIAAMALPLCTAAMPAAADECILMVWSLTTNEVIDAVGVEASDATECQKEADSRNKTYTGT